MDHRTQFIEQLKDDDDPITRAIFADWLDENGESQFAGALRSKMKVQLEPVKEICLEELLCDSDWADVFADVSIGHTDKTIDPCPPGSDVDCSPPNRSDVKEIVAAVNGENDGDSWTGVFRLFDGRYLLAEGGCYYAGWG